MNRLIKPMIRFLILIVCSALFFSNFALADSPALATEELPAISSKLFAIIRIVLMCVAFLIAIVPHEVAHGIAALKLGDPTAKQLGRITLNPIAHIDLMMTIIFPAILILSGAPFIFGGAKPVPVDPRYFKNPRKGMALVAIAGPLTNFIIATICMIAIPISGFVLQLLHLPDMLTGLSMEFLYLCAAINLFLGVFNLLPIPPLDGGRIAVGFLPIKLARSWARLEPFGILIVILLLLGGAIDFIIKPVFLYLELLSKLFL